MSIFDKFKNGINQEEINKAIERAKENGGDYKEVPTGKYTAKVEKIELGTTKGGADKIATWFKITEGEFKGSLVFKNCVMNEQWQIDQAFNFITDLGADLDSGELNNDEDLQDYLNEVLEEISDIGLEYKIQHTVNNKGFGDVQIKEIIE